MGKNVYDTVVGNGLNAASPSSRNVIQKRCSRCGMKWESGYYEEVCPLEELELSFLSSDWFYSAGSWVILTDGVLRGKI